MMVCDDGHEEVAFEGVVKSDCPACEYAEEVREEMQEKIDELQDKLDEHECE